MTLTETLAELSVLNRDNGCAFTDTSRLDAVSRCLEGTKYTRINESGLFHLYSPQKSLNEPAVIISSHIDCEENITECFSKLLTDGLMLGTFDNMITNAAVLYLMLKGKLNDNVLVAFTGDEEEDSRGAHDVIAFSEENGINIRHVIVLDVTDVGWENEADFTIENDFWNAGLGKKVIASAENSGYKWYFVPSDPDDIPEFVNSRYVIPFEADEDESWMYDESDTECFCLCLPVKGNMHSNRGIYARQKSFERYTDMLSRISRI